MPKILKVNDDGSRSLIETAYDETRALEVLIILSAHERLNGRKTKYTVSPPLDPNTEYSYEPPQWAINAFRADPAELSFEMSDNSVFVAHLNGNTLRLQVTTEDGTQGREMIARETL